MLKKIFPSSLLVSTIRKNKLLNINQFYKFKQNFFSDCCDDPNHNHNQNLSFTRNKENSTGFTNLIDKFDDNNFNENLIFPLLLEIIKQPWNKKNETSLQNSYSLCIRNLGKINKLQSLIAIIDKSRLLPKNFIKLEEKNAILDRALIVSINYYKANLDNGLLLKSIFLVGTLNKFVLSHNFYEKMIEKTLNEITNIDLDYLLTILEGVIYNKLAIKPELVKNFIKELIKKIESFDIRKLKTYSKFLSLVNYRVKNFPEMDEKTLFDPVIIKLCNSILNYMIQAKNIENYILSFVEFMSHLTLYKELTKSTTIVFISNKLAKEIEDFFTKNNFQRGNLPFSLVIPYMNTFYNSKTSFLPKKLLDYLQKSFLTYKFNDLKDFTVYLYFLVNHSQNFEIPAEANVIIMEFLNKEKNLMILIKLLNIYERSKPINPTDPKYALQEEILGILEEKCMSISKRMNYPNNLLLTMFQHFAYLGKGKKNNWLIFFKHFSEKNNLEELGMFNLIVKLLPTAGNKAKQEFKMTTNIALNMSPVVRTLLDLKNKSDLVKAIEDFWTVLKNHIIENLHKIYPDKYSMILSHFVYANLTFRKNIEIYIHMQELVLKNFNSLSGTQISGIMYSYGRVIGKLKIIEFFLSCSKPLKEKIIANPNDFPDSCISKIYWAYSQGRLYEESVLNLLENKMMSKFKEKIDLEGLSSYLQALALFNLCETNKMQIINDLILKKLNDKSENVPVSHAYLWAYSLIVLENNNKEVWNCILSFILRNRETSSDLIQNYFLYLIYLHLILNPIAVKNNENQLKDIKKALILNKTSILDYLSKAKKNKISDNEGKINQFLEKRKYELFGIKNHQEDIMEIFVEGNRILLFDDVKSIENYDKDFIENFFILPYLTDFRYGNIIVEHNGEVHYIYNNSKKQYFSNGISELKKRFLKVLGFKYIEVPFQIGNDEYLIINYVRSQMIK